MQLVDLPPLDDPGWDRLLRAVVGQPPTVGDPTAPLATPFPSPLRRDRDEGDGAPAATVDEQTIDLDAYA